MVFPHSLKVLRTSGAKLSEGDA